MYIPNKFSYNLTSDVYVHVIKSIRLPSSLLFPCVGGEPGAKATYMYMYIYNVHVHVCTYICALCIIHVCTCIHALTVRLTMVPNFSKCELSLVTELRSRGIFRIIRVSEGSTRIGGRGPGNM